VVRAADDYCFRDDCGDGGVWVLHGDGGEVEIGEYFVGGVRGTERLKYKSRFVNFPQGFQIHRNEVGQTGWEDGYTET
jgi:hypothetical protein